MGRARQIGLRKYTADDAYKGSDPSDVGEIVAVETWTITPTNTALASKWNACYDGVQRANDVLNVMALAKDISEDDVKLFSAESRFLRAHYHFELKKVFNMVPFVDETVNLDKQNDISNTADIWPQIEADLQFAVDNLPETQPQVGRVNKWAAMALLAKAYLFDKSKGYEAALPLLTDVIANGQTSGGQKYALVNYYSNFNPALKKMTRISLGCSNISAGWVFNRLGRRAKRKRWRYFEFSLFCWSRRLLWFL
jgi:hypothetical protein